MNIINITDNNSAADCTGNSNGMQNLSSAVCVKSTRVEYVVLCWTSNAANRR